MWSFSWKIGMLGQLYEGWITSPPDFFKLRKMSRCSVWPRLSFSFKKYIFNIWLFSILYYIILYSMPILSLSCSVRFGAVLSYPIVSYPILSTYLRLNISKDVKLLFFSRFLCFLMIRHFHAPRCPRKKQKRATLLEF